MSPLSTRIVHTMSEVKINARSVGSTNSTLPPHGPDPRTVSTVLVLSLSFSALSVASAILALYWFVKMRRAFRHDLIMVLIQSNMFRSLWSMVVSAVLLARGPIAGDPSAFCQVQRLFLTLCIGTSDFAVLIIAIHSALLIFRSHTSSRNGGLYPYRHVVFAMWVLFPITMAGLGFIKGNSPGVNSRHFCYFPIRPFLYRYLLAWVPRFIIFFSILGIYVSIYFFVRKKFHRFDHESKSRAERLNSSSKGKWGSKRRKRHSIPSTSTLACHGLILEPCRENPVAIDADVGAEARENLSLTLDSHHSALLFKTGTTRFILQSIFTGDRSSSEAPTSHDLSTVDSCSFTGTVTLQPLPAYLGPSPSTPNDIGFIDTSRPRTDSWRDELVSRVTFSPSQSPASKRSTANIFSIPRPGPPNMSTETQTPISQLEIVNSRRPSLAASEMLRIREKIRRQLRLSCVYPFVHVGMWILPFISDFLEFHDLTSAPVGLGYASTIIASSQAAVDCWLFFSREKPWKHIHEHDGSFWESLKLWLGWKTVRSKKRKHEPGKTRDDMARDSRAAYHRREDELAQRRSKAVHSAQSGSYRRERTWWEAEGLNGPIDTVQEEGTDPDENITSNSRQSSDDETNSADLPSPEVSKENNDIKEASIK